MAKKKTNFGNKKEEVIVDLNNEPVLENKVGTEGVTNGATNEPVAKKTYQEMMGYTFSDYGYFN